MIMTEERSKSREFLPLVFIVNCFKKPLLMCNLCLDLMATMTKEFIRITKEQQIIVFTIFEASVTR